MNGNVLKPLGSLLPCCKHDAASGEIRGQIKSD